MPGRLEDLVTLPGVGRKTAFVVLGNAYGRPGITVDTHFQRLVRRWRWTDETDPDKIEAAVGALFPKSEWTDLSHHVIWHGRRICHARKPACGACPIAPLCPAYGEGETDPEKARKLLKYEKGGFPGQRLNPRRPISTPAANRRRPWGPRDGTISVPSGVGEGRTTGVAMTRTSGTQDGPLTLSGAGLPDWLAPILRVAETVEPTQLSRFLPPENGSGRQSAVLILFGEGERGPELLLMERAGSLRSHPGQPSFPGGALDPEDGDPQGDGPLRAALREAREETGLDPAGVRLFGVLPRLYIPVSRFVVTPVLGWWREPSPVGVVDPNETARVFTVPVADLTDPANRATAVHPSGHTGPAFLVESALVWGFTAGVIDRLLHYAGWERPWDRGKQVPLDWRA